MEWGWLDPLRRWVGSGSVGVEGMLVQVHAGGEVNESFLRSEFRFRYGVGHTLVVQSFGITQLINAKILRDAKQK